MTEQLISLAIKVGIIIFAWVFAQLQPFAESGLQQGFDQLFSIGLMMLFLVYMIYENRKKDQKQEDHHQAYVDLVVENQKVLRDVSQSNKDVAKTIERTTKAQDDSLQRLTKAFEKIEDKL